MFSSPKNQSQVGINISYAKGVKSPASLAAYFSGHQNADHDTHSYNLADWLTITSVKIVLNMQLWRCPSVTREAINITTPQTSFSE